MLEAGKLTAKINHSIAGWWAGDIEEWYNIFDGRTYVRGLVVKDEETAIGFCFLRSQSYKKTIELIKQHIEVNHA